MQELDTMAKKTRTRRPESAYPLAEAAKHLGKSRATLMRVLPWWEEATGARPTQDERGRWLLPRASVDTLASDPAKYEALARRAGEHRDDSLAAIRRDLAEIKQELAKSRSSAEVMEFLAPFVIASIDRVAPEKGSLLLAVMQDLGAGIHFTAENRIYADHSDMRVGVGIPALARLWALSYAYYVFYVGFSEQKNRNPGQTLVNLRSSGPFRSAGRLLRWALVSALDGENSEWPVGAPRPENASGSDDVKAVNEIFLCAVGFILHHELAHLRLKHRPYVKKLDPAKKAEALLDSVLQEKEADREAAAWLLEGVAESDFRHTKRGLGIALGLSWLTMCEFYAGAPQQSTHPPGYDRLHQTLSQHFHDTNSLVWAYVASLAFLHLQHANAPLELNQQFTTFKAAVDYCIDVTAAPRTA